jgi:hypothetical protein
MTFKEIADKYIGNKPEQSYPENNKDGYQLKRFDDGSLDFYAYCKFYYNGFFTEFALEGIRLESRPFKYGGLYGHNYDSVGFYKRGNSFGQIKIWRKKLTFNNLIEKYSNGHFDKNYDIDSKGREYGLRVISDTGRIFYIGHKIDGKANGPFIQRISLCNEIEFYKNNEKFGQSRRILPLIQ